MSERDGVGELRRFLKERRARVRPSDVGLPASGRRRVPGLRREEVASLAGIGVSWYTTLENGDARGVSETTLLAVATALRLSESERQYLLALAMPKRSAASLAPEPDENVLATLRAIAFPAYVISATWNVLAFNDAFRRVWAIGAHEAAFNAVERMFLDRAARALHGERFTANVAPVLAMLQSSAGRQPHATELQRLCERVVEDPDLRSIWEAYEITSPLLSNACTIESPIGTFHYETLTLPISESQAIVVQVPDEPSRERLARATMRRGSKSVVATRGE